MKCLSQFPYFTKPLPLLGKITDCMPDVQYETDVISQVILVNQSSNNGLVGVDDTSFFLFVCTTHFGRAIEFNNKYLEQIRLTFHTNHFLGCLPYSIHQCQPSRASLSFQLPDLLSLFIINFFFQKQNIQLLNVYHSTLNKKCTNLFSIAALNVTPSC